MEDRCVALLRGVNVGTAKRVAMADLRKLVETLGYLDVRTVLNSGNVVFTARRGMAADAAARIQTAMAARLGVATRVTVLTGRDVAEALRDNPLASIADNPSRLLVMACPDAKALRPLQRLLSEPWAPEALALGSRVAYLWCPGGIAHGRLWTSVERTLGGVGTARNLTTMTRILELVDGSSTRSTSRGPASSPIIQP